MGKVTNVWLFVPNLIGYFRVVTAIMSFFLAFNHPKYFSTLYLVSFFLDGLDGHMARKLNQCSKLGAVLDMITDRFATAGLALILSHMYPDYLVVFILLNSLDFVSHYVRMYITMLLGADSHKAVTIETHGYLIFHYYTNRIVLGGLCVLNELFYFGLYLMYFWNNSWTQGFTLIMFLGFSVKQYINWLQLVSSMREIAQHDQAAIDAEAKKAKK